MNYYSRTFNTLHKPNLNDKNLYGIQFELFYAFLDYLFLVLDPNIKENYSLKVPKNLYIVGTQKTMRVFMGDDKAIDEVSLIVLDNQPTDQLMTLEEANKFSKQELGFTFDYYFDVKVDQLRSSLLFVTKNGQGSYQERLKKYQEVIDLAQKVLNNGNKDISSDENNKSAIDFFNCFLNAYHQLNEEFERESGIMDFNPRFKARNIVVNPNQCFYVMDFKDTKVQEAYEALSKKLMEKLGVRVIKSGDIFDPNRKNEMVENIWQDIVGSGLVIADISCKNPNVFYELGICDTIGKRVIPICNEQSYVDEYNNQFPFDVQQEFTTIYKNSYSGITSMTEKIVKMVDAIINNKPILVE